MCSAFRGRPFPALAPRNISAVYLPSVTLHKQILINCNSRSNTNPLVDTRPNILQAFDSRLGPENHPRPLVVFANQQSLNELHAIILIKHLKRLGHYLEPHNAPASSPSKTVKMIERQRRSFLHALNSRWIYGRVVSISAFVTPAKATMGRVV